MSALAEATIFSSFKGIEIRPSSQYALDGIRHAKINKHLAHRIIHIIRDWKAGDHFTGYLRNDESAAKATNVKKPGNLVMRVAGPADNQAYCLVADQDIKLGQWRWAGRFVCRQCQGIDIYRIRVLAVKGNQTVDVIKH